MDKPWLQQYETGVPHEIDINEYASLTSLIEKSCHQFSDKVAYVNLGSTLTYKELDEKSQRFANYLKELGLRKGARVAIMSPNLLQYPIALFGILRAGYVIVNTNPLYTVPEIVHQMNDSGAEAILVVANFAKTLEKALPHTAIKHVIVTEIGDVFPWFKRTIVNTVVKYIKKLVPSFHLPQAIRFNEALKKGGKVSYQPVPLGHHDLAFLQYTGGTTGIAKGAMLTHGNMVANVLQASSWIHSIQASSNDIIVTALPLYHIFSLTANCLTFLKFGAKNILITNPRDIPHFINEIKHSGFTAITGVNTLFNALLNHPKFPEIDFSHTKLCLSGGMALQKSVAQRWQQITKTRLLEAYGLTETAPAATINPMYLNDYNGSIGLPLSSTDVSIRDEHYKEVALGETGELCIKGPQVMAGYWQRPEETAAAFTDDGFLKTGDMAKMDEKGFIYLVDRKKDMILVSGFNVYPNEVEQVIGLMPGVLEVGVIGVKNEDSGELVKACIVKRDQELSIQDILNHCREHLTAYKIPKIIEFFNELPKSNVGKILRRALR